jgi:hypothetical protein
VVYSVAEFDNNDDKTSPCFRSFLIGNVRGKCLLVKTLLSISLKHIFINVAGIIGIPHSGYYKKTSVLTELWAVYRPTNK